MALQALPEPGCLDDSERRLPESAACSVMSLAIIVVYGAIEAEAVVDASPVCRRQIISPTDPTKKKGRRPESRRQTALAPNRARNDQAGRPHTRSESRWLYFAH
jgi:hypothetical protein